ncbi:MAG: hypothetical protein ABJG78_12295 [Cyclobacteriaceae bacterium]
MKQFKNYLFLQTILACLLFSNESVAQTVRIVDNNFNAPTGNEVYATLQEAANAADPGDYIYIQPSSSSYGSVIIQKELHLVGIGFNVDKENPQPSTMLDITLRNNSGNTDNASNSTITGLTFRDLYPITYPGAPSFTLSNVTITNCVFQEIQDACCNTHVPFDNLELSENQITERVDFVQVATNILLRNNLFQSTISFNSSSANSGLVANNIIYGNIYKSAEGDNLIIQNNNFISASGSTSAFLSFMRDALIVNNIFYGRTPSITNGGGSSSANFQRNIFTNNMSFSTGNDELPPSGGGAGNTGSGNLEGVSPMFTNAPLSSTWSVSRDFSLQIGSQAIDGGSDGTDIGITGGPYPFPGVNLILKTTAIPTIQIFTTNSLINPGDDLDVRIKAKAN